MMEMTIIHGTVVLQNAGTLSFFYEDTDEFRCRFHLAIKSVEDPVELWVLTFHKISASEIRRRMKRGEVIRLQNGQGQP
jgi:hypothetical protein